VRAAVGVAVQLVLGALERLERRRKRPEGTLVRRELDHPLQAQLALHLLDRLPRLVRDELGDRPAKERPLAHSSGGGPSPFELAVALRTSNAPPVAVTTAARTAGLFGRFACRSTDGTALLAALRAFCLAVNLTASQTAQPSTAFRLVMTPMGSSLAFAYAVAAAFRLGGT